MTYATRSAPELAESALPPYRQLSLLDALSRQRRRTGGFPLSRVLLILGGLCLPAGFIVMILGWYGAAHTLNLYEQNSYMISGGFIGLGLVILGGFLYFGYWMTRQINLTQSMLQQSNRDSALLRMELSEATASALSAQQLLSSQATLAQPVVAQPNTTVPTVAASRSVPEFVATPKGTLIHRRDCSAVLGKANLRAVSGDEPGLRPCQICQPFDD